MLLKLPIAIIPSKIFTHYSLFIPVSSPCNCVNDDNVHNATYGECYTGEQGVSCADFSSEPLLYLHVPHHHCLRNYFINLLLIQ